MINQPKRSFIKGTSPYFRNLGCWNCCNLAIDGWKLEDEFFKFWGKLGLFSGVKLLFSLTLRYGFWGAPPSWHRTSRGRYLEAQDLGYFPAMTSFSGVFLWDWIDRCESRTKQQEYQYHQRIPLGVPTLKTNILYVGILDVSPFPTMRQFFRCAMLVLMEGGWS